MPRSEDAVALEWLGHMRKEIERLKERLDWLDRGISYVELNFKQKLSVADKETKVKDQ